MKQLNRELVPAPRHPEKILQFGEGNFLRAFVDVFFDKLNESAGFGGGIAVVQPLPDGLTELLNEQDGLYTVLLRGLENGQPASERRVVTAITRGINPYSEYDAYIACARNPELRFVVSNTTEAGIVFREGDLLSDKPQISFPGKVTAFLYERFRHFAGASDKGLVFLPCELIDNNGAELRRIVLQYAKTWSLSTAFISWLEECCIFTSTLVDRIVTGYPRAEAETLCAELGYEDKLLDTGEIFHFWVIEGPVSLADELPFHKHGMNVLFTDDAVPYKTRKVRILNGAHTSLVPVALLCGLETVGDSMKDEDLRRYVHRLLFDEVIPTLDLDKADLTSFADAVFDRFANPYISHALTSIALNSTSKWRARVLPSVQKSLALTGKLPPLLVFSFAATLEMFAKKLPGVQDSDSIEALFEELRAVEGFESAVNEALDDIRALGCRAALVKRL